MERRHVPDFVPDAGKINRMKRDEDEERKKTEQRRPRVYAPSIYDRDLEEPPRQDDKEPDRGVAQIDPEK